MQDLLTCICCFYVVVANAVTFKFAFYNNELYINRRNIKLFDRAYQTIYGLLQLRQYSQSSQQLLPNVCVRVNGVVTDGDGAGELGFWRKKGTNSSDLFPEHDYWGWAETWSTPFPLYLKVMKDNMIPWGKRVNAVYWTGKKRNFLHMYKGLSFTLCM